MGSIPLPALAARGPEIDDPTQKLLSLRGLMQGQQLQQQQIQQSALQLKMQQQEADDQQKIRAAYMQAGGDLDKTAELAAQSGVNPKTVIGIKSAALEGKQKLATLNKEQLANQKAQAEMVGQQAGAALQAPPEQRAGIVQQGLSQLVQQGVMPQDQAAAAFQQYQQQGDDWLKLHQTAAMSTQQQIEAVQKQQAQEVEIPLKKAQTAAAQSTADKNKMEMTAGGNQALADSRYRNIVMNQKMGKRVSAEDQAFMQAYDAQKKAAQPYGAARIEIARENIDRKDTDYIDKNYVKPANDAEKSYQMFMDAYNNRNNSKTGAESMLALSTHLATTFGNVKGSRVTKDMIQEHLGARGITDSALVAVQKLTNGDVLSPDQWDAFKSLISNSRRLTWNTADKEAKRRGVDISGSVPNDLGGKGDSAAGNDPFAAFGGKRKQ